MNKRHGKSWIGIVCLLLAFSCTGCTGVSNTQPGVSPDAAADLWQEAIYEVAADEYITLRQTPDISAKELARLSVGERMVCLDFEGIFMKVMTEESGLIGYVHGGYVNRVNIVSSAQSAIVPNEGNDYTYERLQQDIAALSKAYPDLFTVHTLAQTADNRDIVLCIVGDPDATHKILLTGAIHGREHMTALLVMKLTEDYVAAMQNGQCESTMDVAFYIIPMLNPDGVTISQKGASGIENEGLRAAIEEIIESENTAASLWKSNANGVDLNRNFPVGWELLNDDGPSSNRFRGEWPLCEVETKAVEKLLNTVSFDITVSYHATGSLQYWQYQQEGILLTQTKALAQVVYETTKYPLATAKAEENLEGGGLRDWALMQFHIPSVTIEIGCLPTPLQSREWAAIYQRNRGLFEALAGFVLEQ